MSIKAGDNNLNENLMEVNTLAILYILRSIAVLSTTPIHLIYHVKNIQVVCKEHLHLCYPSNHDKLFPSFHSCRFQLYHK